MGIEHFGLFGVDQRHRALDHAELFERGIIGLGQNINNRVADAQNVELSSLGRSVGHGNSSKSGSGFEFQASIAAAASQTMGVSHLWRCYEFPWSWAPTDS